VKIAKHMGYGGYHLGMLQRIYQWHKKLFKTRGESYLSYQDTFVWRKITFLWSDSKNWEVPAPFPLLMEHIIALK